MNSNVNTVKDTVTNALINEYWKGAGLYGIDRVKHDYGRMAKTKVKSFKSSESFAASIWFELVGERYNEEREAMAETVRRIDISDSLNAFLDERWQGSGEYVHISSNPGYDDWEMYRYLENANKRFLKFVRFDNVYEFKRYFVEQILRGNPCNLVEYMPNYVQVENHFQVGQFYAKRGEFIEYSDLYLCVSKTDKTVLFMNSNGDKFRKRIKFSKYVNKGKAEVCVDGDPDSIYSDIEFRAKVAAPFCELTAEVYPEWADYIHEHLDESMCIAA